MDLEEQKRKTFLLVRWLYLKRIRQFSIIQKSKWDRLLRYSTDMLQLIIFYGIYRTIFERFDTHRSNLYHEFRVKVLTLKMKSRQKKFFKRKGIDVQERTKNFIRQNLNC